MTRPGSSHGHLSSIEASLDVIYVAEYHESLQHVLVFLTIPGASASPQSAVEAEVLLREDDDLPRLIVRCGVNTSSPLELPARVNVGKKDIRLVGENHYEVKLQTPAPSNRSRPGTPHSPSPELDSPAIMDATYFTTTNPTSLVCTSCSLPLVQASRITSYRDLPSEHWAELVDAWMCHADMKLHEQVQKN
ncbi:ubiquitin-conjugating enzyme E2-binding protein [Cristinia sonorae]|uniref:Ubiquitin-conjugating enzyme E2-binding protein n=1 Tax=Cristinia sonorae TaxID=1940300 RepID=A0A8K0UUS0_9AGAR|nr:ubiquitin-conjugating enzyme E2-binding protein [Cristinia sonorae]